MANEVWTIASLLSWTTKYLQQKGFDDNPRLEAQLLLAHVLKCSKMDLYVRFEEQPSEADRAIFKGLLKQRIEGTPVDYLLGNREFFLLSFDVTPAVLIPREETGLLVTEALRLFQSKPDANVVDIGTGSGCIAVAFASRHKTATVTATDISEDALAIARRNASKHNVAERIRFLQGDLFGAIADGETFDAVLSNPPYIAHDEFEGLDISVRDHEPRLALDGGPDGLDFYRRLAADAPRFLVAGGWLLLEIGYQQDEAVRGILETRGGFEIADTIRDGSKHPRIVRAKWQGG